LLNIVRYLIQNSFTWILDEIKKFTLKDIIKLLIGVAGLYSAFRVVEYTKDIEHLFSKKYEDLLDVTGEILANI
jgi:hypothetical protein